MMEQQHHTTGISSLAAAAAAGRRPSATRTKSQVPVCSFFARGECSRGSSCRFRHELDDSPSSTYSRQKPSSDSVNSDRPICSFFARGYCRRGEACNFRHELPTTQTEQAATDSPTSVVAPEKKTDTPPPSVKPKSDSSEWLPEKRWIYGESGWYYGAQGEESKGKSNGAVQQPMSSLAAAAAKARGEPTTFKKEGITQNSLSVSNRSTAGSNGQKSLPPEKQTAAVMKDSSQSPPGSAKLSSDSETPSPTVAPPGEPNSKVADDITHKSIPLQPLRLEPDNVTREEPIKDSSPLSSKSDSQTDVAIDANEEAGRRKRHQPVPGSSHQGDKTSETSEAYNEKKLDEELSPVQKHVPTHMASEEQLEQPKDAGGAEKMSILPSLSKLKIDTDPISNKKISIGASEIEVASPLATGLDSPAEGAKTAGTPSLKHGAQKKPSITVSSAQTPKSAFLSPTHSSLAKAAAAGRARQEARKKERKPSGQKFNHEKNTKPPHTPSDKLPYWERLYQDGEKRKQNNIKKQQQTDAECTFAPHLSLSSHADHGSKSRRRKQGATTRSWTGNSNNRGGNKKGDRRRGRGRGVPTLIGERGVTRGSSARWEENSVMSEITIEKDDLPRNSRSSRRRQRSGSPSSLPTSGRGGRRVAPKNSIRNQESASIKSGGRSPTSGRGKSGNRAFEKKKAGSDSMKFGDTSSLRGDGTSKISNQNSRPTTLEGTSKTHRTPSSQTSQAEIAGAKSYQNDWARKIDFANTPPQATTPRPVKMGERDLHPNKDDTEQKDVGNERRDVYGKRSVRALTAKFEGATGRNASIGEQGKEAETHIDVNENNKNGRGDANKKHQWVPPPRRRWADDSDDGD